ncbi:hypothetical protein HUZ36_15880 [Pseudoalteromonas sp. McH1-7]|uniref:hypothetical protein n=1 Tax=unclassified Pseudoalteromonas TaxID=194690 RepID=UPI001592294F|nr:MULTISPECIES: hypothetical protein [unclassified Pseudoalteromonas]NUZ12263.1 hypothetical protein [Pseudoalteromonas sp. McH1-7]USD30730.1 hypothetical protein J8Z24_17280 [Pseudoalteromonas sp. SCSIO 43201]
MKILIVKYLFCLVGFFLLVLVLCQEYEHWKTMQLCSNKCAHLTATKNIRVHAKISGAVCYCGKAPTHILIVES